MKKYCIPFRLIVCIAAVTLLGSCSIWHTLIEPSSLLWRISGNGLEQPSYLYGTIHIKDKRVFAFSDAVKQAFAETSLLAVEIVPDSTAQMGLLSKIMLDSGRTLESLLSPEDYELVQNALQEKLGMQAMVADRMKPIFVGTLLMLDKMSNDYSVTVDEHFQQQAYEQHKRVVGIETIDEQFAALESISLEEQARLLVEQIRDSTKTDLLVERMIEAYTDADLDALMELIAESEMPGKATHALLTKRNYIMAERAAVLMRKESVFIAIGAGHLAGEEGVIDLLRRKGYTVKPVQ